jgi:hypothetical protein
MSEILSIGAVPSKAEVAEFLKSVADAKMSTFAGVGEGQDLRLEAEGLTGAALEVDERLIHLSAFRMPKNLSQIHCWAEAQTHSKIELFLYRGRVAT